jgi:hypothetical protein
MIGVSPLALAALTAAPAGDERLHAFRIAKLGGEHQRGITVPVADVGARALAEQVAQPGRVAPLHQDVERTLTGVEILRIDDLRARLVDRRRRLRAVAIPHRLQEVEAFGKLRRRRHCQAEQHGREQRRDHPPPMLVTIAAHAHVPVLMPQSLLRAE